MGNKLVVRNVESLTVWTERIAACKSSGKNVSAWCEENGINPKTYYYWHYKLLKVERAYSEPVASTFYDISPCADSDKRAVATVHIGLFSTDIYSGADEETITAICRALKTC